MDVLLFVLDSRCCFCWLSGRRRESQLTSEQNPRTEASKTEETESLTHYCHRCRWTCPHRCRPTILRLGHPHLARLNRTMLSAPACFSLAAHVAIARVRDLVPPTSSLHHRHACLIYHHSQAQAGCALASCLCRACIVAPREWLRSTKICHWYPVGRIFASKCVCGSRGGNQPLHGCAHRVS